MLTAKLLQVCNSKVSQIHDKDVAMSVSMSQAERSNKTGCASKFAGS